MKSLNISMINSLFQSDWHPKQGDYVKENSINDGKIMRNRMRKHKIKVWVLSLLIFGMFAAAMILLSIDYKFPNIWETLKNL